MKGTSSKLREAWREGRNISLPASWHMVPGTFDTFGDTPVTDQN